MDQTMDGPLRLKDFLEEAELQQYYDGFRDVLKVNKISQLKFVNTVDLKELGLSKPEQRRYKKIYTKYFSKHYLTKIKRLLSSKRTDVPLDNSFEAAELSPTEPDGIMCVDKVSTKHIIPFEDITINKELGTGEFGVVQQGTWTNNNQRIQVAIKCLGRERMNSNSFEFLKEAAVMHSIEHQSVVRLYGVVLHLDSLMLVTELAPLRSLLECLKEFALRECFPVLTLCNFAEQICDGMTYLESKRLIHRDLAARNILVFNKSKVKISDFGLSRALGVGKDYYQTNYNVNLKLPVAWCAPECITYLRFTSASDVWAYAVTLWEMFSYGFQPWAAFSGQQILTAIDEPNHQRLERPECCPEQYYAMMMDCWAHEPGNRPTFRQLGQKLTALAPEQLVAKSSSTHSEGRRASMLQYKAGDKITVIGKERLSKSSMWVGALNNGACGLFHPDNASVYMPPPKAPLSPLPSTSLDGPKGWQSLRSSLTRRDSKRHQIHRDMISAPQGEVKHMGHVGADGAHFGDVAFLHPAAEPPRQVVNPYKPSEDLEETPLLNPNSPSHLTGGTATVPPAALLQPTGHDTTGRFPSKRHVSSRSFMSKVKSATLGKSFRHEDKAASTSKAEPTHEYQEIDDDESSVEMPPPDSSVIRRSQTDFSQSLIDEMECMFQNLNVPQSSARKSSVPNQRSQTLGSFGKKKNQDIVRPMTKDEQKTLEKAVVLANQLTTKSMNDLDDGVEAPPSPAAKFHFRFPSITHPHQQHTQLKDAQAKIERRNFSQEAQSVPDLQSTITESSRLAYASLIEQPTPASLVTQLQDPGRRPSVGRRRAPPVRPRSTDTTDMDAAQGNNALPLPSKGSKPPLVDKTRHVRVHPLVLPAPRPPDLHDYQNLINQGGRSADQISNARGSCIVTNGPIHGTNGTIHGANGTIYGTNGTNGRCRPEPDYVNVYVNCGVDVCDGASEEPLSPDLGSLLKDAPDHVSVEDLLEFADQKPCGRQRGTESDEVRILCKVLSHQEVTKEECMEALDCTEWKIHAAVKTFRLRAELQCDFTLPQCAHALRITHGDLVQAAALLRLGPRHS